MIVFFDVFFRLFRFYLKAKTRHGVHSPFVFELVERVLEDCRTFYAFDEIELVRQQLLESEERISVRDLGAGSQVSNGEKRRVATIARSAVSPRFQGQTLFRLVEWLKPRHILELGTSLGVTSLHLAEAAPADAKIWTLEGSPEIAHLARKNFNWFYDCIKDFRGLRYHNAKISKFLSHYKNEKLHEYKQKINLVEGNFDEILSGVLHDMKKIDFAYIDGNHRKEPTLRYFEQCLPFVHEYSVLIFDDVHWSPEMEAAWQTICADKRVRLSIDLFWCGMVFFRNEQKEKEHFDLIPSRLKPFSLGFFS
jgi:predicted O-methyltransferase YrrM